MKKLIYFLLILTLIFSCSKPLTPEQIRFQTVIEHLKDHYKEPNYTYIYEDSLKQLIGFSKDKKYYIPSENHNTYYYYNEKGDKVKGYVYIITENIIDEKENYFVQEEIIKIIILSEDNEIVWCGTDYPGIRWGECTRKITNSYKCGYE